MRATMHTELRDARKRLATPSSATAERGTGAAKEAKIARNCGQRVEAQQLGVGCLLFKL